MLLQRSGWQIYWNAHSSPTTMSGASPKITLQQRGKNVSENNSIVQLAGYMENYDYYRFKANYFSLDPNKNCVIETNKKPRNIWCVFFSEMSIKCSVVNIVDAEGRRECWWRIQSLCVDVVGIIKMIDMVTRNCSIEFFPPHRLNEVQTKLLLDVFSYFIECLCSDEKAVQLPANKS